MQPPPSAIRMQRWRDFSARQRLKSTQQRDLIVAEFLRAAGHLSIEELLARVRRLSPRIGYVTVYRTLKLLEQAGLAVGRHFGDGVTRYELGDEAVRAHHDHLICTSCGRIIEFENPEIERLQEEVARRYGFEVHRHKLEIYGRCQRAECRRRGGSKRRPRPARPSPGRRGR